MRTCHEKEIIETLPTLQRLALAYAPARARAPVLALLALDARLASIVRSSREPMLAQMRLAWWREQLLSPPGDYSGADPLLGALRDWNAQAAGLAVLADGWEAMSGDTPLAAASFEALAEARGEAFAALARLLGHARSADAALRLGRNWALADLFARLSHPDERRAAAELAHVQDWRWQRLPRDMRPLAVLHGLAQRAVRRGEGLDALRPGAIMTAIRLGLLGR